MTVISPKANIDSNRAVGVAHSGDYTMKTILAALVVLSFVAGVVAPASAAEPFSIKQLDEDFRGGHGQG